MQHYQICFISQAIAPSQIGCFQNKLNTFKTFHYVFLAPKYFGKCHISVSRQMTCGVSKIAEAAEESARKGRPVPIAWKPDEVPNGYIMNT